MRIAIYKNTKGKKPFSIWLESLKDQQTICRIRDRIERIEEFGYLGDCRRIDQKIYELRFHFGAGYRVYFIYQSEEIITLLCGGDKTSQHHDIDKARQLLEEIENE